MLELPRNSARLASFKATERVTSPRSARCCSPRPVSQQPQTARPHTPKAALALAMLDFANENCPGRTTTIKSALAVI